MDLPSAAKIQLWPVWFMHLCQFASTSEFSRVHERTDGRTDERKDRLKTLYPSRFQKILGLTVRTYL